MIIYQDNDVIMHTATQGDALAREKQMNIKIRFIY